MNVPVRRTEVTVRHTGYTDPALPEGKLQRDCKILEAELAERPDDPFVLFNLGAIAVQRQDWSTSLGHRQRSLRGSALSESIVRVASGGRIVVSGQWSVASKCGGSGELRVARNSGEKEPTDSAASTRVSTSGEWLGIVADGEKEPTSSAASTGHLRPPYPAQPRRPGRRTRRPGRGPAALEDGPRRLPGRLRGHGAGKDRSESRSFPPTASGPTPSASARCVARDTSNPALTMKRPCRSRASATSSVLFERPCERAIVSVQGLLFG